MTTTSDSILIVTDKVPTTKVYYFCRLKVLWLLKTYFLVKDESKLGGHHWTRYFVMTHKGHGNACLVYEDVYETRSVNGQTSSQRTEGDKTRHSAPWQRGPRKERLKTFLSRFPFSHLRLYFGPTKNKRERRSPPWRFPSVYRCHRGRGWFIKKEDSRVERLFQVLPGRRRARCWGSETIVGKRRNKEIWFLNTIKRRQLLKSWRSKREGVGKLKS